MRAKEPKPTMLCLFGGAAEPRIMGPAARRGVAGDAIKSATVEALRRAGPIKVSLRVYEFLKTVNLRTLRRNLRYMGKTASDGLSIPPLRLVALVAGTADIQNLLECGQRAASCTVAALERRESTSTV